MGGLRELTGLWGGGWGAGVSVWLQGRTRPGAEHPRDPAPMRKASSPLKLRKHRTGGIMGKEHPTKGLLP